MLTPKQKIRTGEPLWLSYPVPHLETKPLTRDLKTDIVIIGAGITGAMAAESLADMGFKVILLDRRGPLKGATSATTALLQYEIDNPLSMLQKQIGHDKAAAAWRRSKLGLESLAAKIQSLAISCGMRRVPSLYLAGNVLGAQELKEEAALRRAIGIHTDYCDRAALETQYGIERTGALRSYDNLSVNPLRLAAGFLKAAQARRAEIYAPTVAEKVEPGRDHVRVTVSDGPTITAKHVIYATGYEIPKEVRTKRHSLHSTYAIATRPQPGKLWPEKCFLWEASTPYLYMRTTPDGRVICGGEDEDFHDTEKRDALLPSKTLTIEKKLKKLFPQLDTRADYAWCGSFGASVTGLPTIGEIPGMANCFAIMAYGGNGITFSRIAAELLTATLTGRDDPDSSLFTFS